MALDILRDKLQYSLLTEDLELLEKAFFILRSQLYRDSHCLNSSVQERYGKSMEKLAFIFVSIFRMDLMLKKMNLIFKQIRRIREIHYD